MNFKKAAAAASKILLKLDQTCSDTSGSAYSRNIFDQYWRTDLIDELADLYRSMMALAPNAEERFASGYRLAAHLRACLRLSEAAELASQLESERQGSAANGVLNLLALIAARRGRLDEARMYALRISKADPTSPFRVSDAELVAESARAFEDGNQ